MPKMSKFRFDIENKILIPFTVLILLPILLLGFFSYWNGYGNLVENDTKYQTAQLKHILIYLEGMNEGVERGDYSRKKAENMAIRMMENADLNHVIVYGDKEIFSSGLALDQKTAKLIGGKGPGNLEKGKNLYIYDTFKAWDWTIVFSIDKSIFREELISLQKNTLLLTIIFLVLSMQAIIIIAHNISKPIRHFADVCRRIEGGKMDEKISIKRNDEIGILSDAFDNMIDQINASTRKLIEITKFNEDILQSIKIGILTIEEDGKKVSTNSEYENIVHRYGDTQIETVLLKEMADTIQYKRFSNRILEFASKSFDAVYLDISITPIKREDGTSYGAICSVNDVTERKKMENNMIKADRLFLVGEFAAGLAHEIRNPLAGLKTGIQVIDNRLDKEKDQPVSELAKGLVYEIDRVNALVTDLLDFSKPQKPNKELVSIREIVEKSVDLAYDRGKKKHIALSFDVDACAECYSFVDKRQVEQAFLNLINNSIDAVSEKGRVEVNMKVSTIGEKNYIEVNFLDNGAGISKEMKEKIFNPFFTTKDKGTGLGLTVTTKLIEENGGFIEIKDNMKNGKRNGAIFSVYLLEHEGEMNENESFDR